MKNKFLKAVSLLLVFTLVLGLGVGMVESVSAATITDYKIYIKNRGQNLQNTYAKLMAGEEVNVVYYGGSVTNGTGVADTSKSWRGLIGQWLVDNFPEATINNINKSYGGTGSKFGAYRLNHDVVSENPDLIFVEFSINDHYDDQVEDATMEDYSTRFETIIRSLRNQLPYCDIVTILTTEQGYLSTNLAGNLHKHAQEHENICIEYDVPSIHVGRALADTIGHAGSWSDYSGDIVHLNEKGYRVYFDVIKQYFEKYLLNGNYDGTAQKHTVPKKPVNDYLLDGDVEYIPVSQEMYDESVKLGGKTNWVVNTKPDSSKVWSTFEKVVLEPKSTSQTADLSFAFEFTGTEVAILDHGENVSAIKVTVDGKTSQKVAYQSVNPVVVVSGLEYGKHKIVIKPEYESGEIGYIYIQGFFIRNQEKCSAKYDHEHKYKNYVSDKNATCKKDGTKTSKCYKKGCDMTDTITDVGTKKKHKYVTKIIRKATQTKIGTGEIVCEYCDRFEDSVLISRIKSVKLSTTSYTYNGKTKKPAVKVKDSAGNTISSKYYTVSGTKSAKNVGKYSITVKFKTKYSGTVKVYYTIKPAKSSVKKLTAAKKSLKVKIEKVSKQTSGYEIQYSTSKKFTKSTTKTKTVSSYKTTSVTLKKLKAKKTYYVKVRTYKKVNGKKIYSSWSSAKSKKTK